jgi:hypothetical protein
MDANANASTPSVEELDFEHAVNDRPLLWDELVHALLVEPPRRRRLRQRKSHSPPRTFADRHGTG